jgi:choline dehydrogenase-like flavoprotein
MRLPVQDNTRIPQWIPFPSWPEHGKHDRRRLDAGNYWQWSPQQVSGSQKKMSINYSMGLSISGGNAYLGSPYRTRSNLSILIHAQATKIIRSGTLKGLPRFTGVDFAGKGSGGYLRDLVTWCILTLAFFKLGVTARVTARKEIILSAGSFNSPQLLMLSGIGNKSALSKLGITTIVNNPSVGQNMSDHVLLANAWTVKSGDTLNDYLSGAGFTTALDQWESTSTGPFACVWIIFSFGDLSLTSLL